VALFRGVRSAYRWSKKQDEIQEAKIREYQNRVFHLRSGTLTLASLDELEHFDVRLEFDPAIFAGPRNARSLVASASAVLGTPCIGEFSVAVHPSGGHDLFRHCQPSSGTMRVDGSTFTLDVVTIEIGGQIDDSGAVAVHAELAVRADQPPLDSDGSRCSSAIVSLSRRHDASSAVTSRSSARVRDAARCARVTASIAEASSSAVSSIAMSATVLDASWPLRGGSVARQ
jgi:hypothetical protein